MSTNEDMMRQEFNAWWEEVRDAVEIDVDDGTLSAKEYGFMAWKASREYMLGMRFAPGDKFEPIRYTVPVITQTAGANPNPMLFMDTVRTIDDGE